MKQCTKAELNSNILQIRAEVTLFVVGNRGVFEEIRHAFPSRNVVYVDDKWYPVFANSILYGVADDRAKRMFIVDDISKVRDDVEVRGYGDNSYLLITKE